ncbi:MAG: hypothetical protein H6718_06740 [Polyangiaceae bacterium]|nr:hypothetical protein [Polyangiaceae bacterium]
MLNLGTKKAALARLRQAAERHEAEVSETTQAAIELHGLRCESVELIVQVENLVNRLANAPKEFERVISEVRVEVSHFNDTVERLHVEGSRVERVSGGTAASGIAAGVGVAAFGPTAAMAVATTWGTASTGTAIAALSGAAQTSAALAWLGGGATAAGGGGMAAGQAFLALAGPVGWTIGGVAIAGGVALTHVRNGRIAKEATDEAERIEGEVRALGALRTEIGELSALTQEHTDGSQAQLREMSPAPDDYLLFTLDQKAQLAALINNIRTLGKLLNRQVSDA